MCINLDEKASSTLNMLLYAKGNYTLFFFVQVPGRIMVGKLGSCAIQSGCYAYTGSAFGKGSSDLGERILRHIRKKKAKRWHIDYLLSDKDVYLKAIVAGVMSQNLECNVNRAIKETFHAQVPFFGFGSSDCKKRCGSHLLFLGQSYHVVEKTVELYRKKAKKVFIMSFGEL